MKKRALRLATAIALALAAGGAMAAGNDAGVTRATLDNGSREVQVAQAQALPDNSGFSGKTTDGVAVELQIKLEACADTMSGEEFAASAQLKVGDQSFSGCGRFLAE